MSVLGWMFMITSVSFVWLLSAYCYYRVLSSPEPPPEALHDFHSA
jgi:hypothetical protein